MSHDFPGAGVDRLATTIATEQATWRDPVVDRAIFGVVDPRVIAERLDALAREALGSAIRAPLFYRVSVGCVAGVELDDGRRVVVKVQSGKRPERQLEAFFAFRRHLRAHHFPCPDAIVGPRRVGDAWATIDAWDERGSRADAHDPSIRRALAISLAELVELGKSFEGASALGPAWFSGLAEGRVFPTPHSPLFDFTANADAASWIDALAAEARAHRGAAAGERVVGHFDWRVEHLRFDEGRVVTSYDWDSLHFERETVLVGATAHAFTMDFQRTDVVRTPTIDEVRALVADYESARGRSFSNAERRTVAASCVYSLAYTARCNHALSPTTLGFDGDLRPLLRAEGRRLLDRGLD